MDTQTVQAENIVVPEAEQIQATQVGVEQTPIAETVTSVPTPPTTAPPVVTTSDIPMAQTDPVAADSVDPAELSDLTTADVDKADENWIGRVQTVIKDDEGKPYKEEYDAEKLNEEYMKTRFNVDVDAPMEEKN